MGKTECINIFLAALVFSRRVAQLSTIHYLDQQPHSIWRAARQIGVWDEGLDPGNDPSDLAEYSMVTALTRRSPHPALSQFVPSWVHPKLSSDFLPTIAYRLQLSLAILQRLVAFSTPDPIRRTYSSLASVLYGSPPLTISAFAFI